MKITRETAPEAEAEALRDTETGQERRVRCATCGGRLAAAGARTEVDGAHEHSFMNPSAIRFTVACFAPVPGCVPEGERSTVWTWFPGRAWQIALCKTCGAHVGWSFHASDVPSFHALITDRIVRD